MILHYKDAEGQERNIEIEVDDDSYRMRSIMGEHTLTLKFSLPGYMEIPIGAYCEYQGLIYTLETPENIKKNGERNYEYTLVMQSDQHKLTKFMFRNTIPGDTRLKFSYTARPYEFLWLLIDNLNERDSGWSFGDDYIEAAEKTVSFNHNTCLDALRMIAEAFETEWEVKGKTIHLRTTEYFKDNPLPLSYGRGNGFLPGLGRAEYSDVKPVERLFTQGGDRNIDASKYRREDATGQIGSRELLMPPNQPILYDGTYFEDEEGFNLHSPDLREYITDESGASVIRSANAGRKGLIEGSIDLTGIYPMREGIVASVIPVDPDKNFYDFTDDGTNPDGSPNPVPNYNDYQIGGETMTVIFQTGMLTGREFEVIYKHSGYFEIVPQTIDGVDMPDRQFRPEVGDKYAIFNVMLPDEYVEAAEVKMFKQAVKYLIENEQPRFTFRGTMDGIWAKKNWDQVGGRIVLGGFIRFSDTQFLPEGMNIRITSVKDYINNPYKPQIELSNNSQSGSWLHNMQRQVAADEVAANTGDRDVVRFAKRRFRDVRQTTEMLQNAMLNFSGSINPITVQTMQAVVGDESLQFDYSRPSQEFRFLPDEEKKMYAPAGTLTHKTLGIDFISPENADKTYMSWMMPEFRSVPLDDPDKSYYMYAKVEREPMPTPDRRFLLSESAIDMDADAGYYHLLVGILNSEINGGRSFAPLYGFTEILPGRITTDRIVSADGTTYFDLAGSEIGGKINFKDGLVSGQIGLGDQNGVNAGMYGKRDYVSGGLVNDNPPRIWAGSTAENFTSAPFRVLHNGTMYATNAYVKGQIEATSGTLKNVSINSVSGARKIELNDASIICVDDAGRAVGALYFDNPTLPFLMMQQYVGSGTANARAYYLSPQGLSFGGIGNLSFYSSSLSSSTLELTHGNSEFQVSFDENGRLSITAIGLPTSAQGLSSGQVWKDSNGYLRIAP